MTNIVIDTNVIVSAVLSPTGTPAAIVSLVSNTETLQVFYSSVILEEYKRVLAYERLNITKEKQNTVINSLQRFGILIEPPVSDAPMIETFRTIHGRLPDRLEEIGGESRDGGGDSLFYHKRNNLQYVIWFGTTLGESIYFDSENRYWRDSAGRGRMFPEKQQRYFKRLINDPYIFFSFILTVPTAIMVASFLGIPFYYMMERIFLLWKRKKGDAVVSTNSKSGEDEGALG